MAVGMADRPGCACSKGGPAAKLLTLNDTLLLLVLQWLSLREQHELLLLCRGMYRQLCCLPFIRSVCFPPGGRFRLLMQQHRYHPLLQQQQQLLQQQLLLRQRQREYTQQQTALLGQQEQGDVHRSEQNRKEIDAAYAAAAAANDYPSSVSQPPATAAVAAPTQGWSASIAAAAAAQPLAESAEAPPAAAAARQGPFEGRRQWQQEQQKQQLERLHQGQQKRQRQEGEWQQQMQQQQEQHHQQQGHETEQYMQCCPLLSRLRCCESIELAIPTDLSPSSVLLLLLLCCAKSLRTLAITGYDEESLIYMWMLQALQMHRMQEQQGLKVTFLHPSFRDSCSSRSKSSNTGSNSNSNTGSSSSSNNTGSSSRRRSSSGKEEVVVCCAASCLPAVWQSPGMWLPAAAMETLLLRCSSSLQQLLLQMSLEGFAFKKTPFAQLNLSLKMHALKELELVNLTQHNFRYPCCCCCCSC